MKNSIEYVILEESFVVFSISIVIRRLPCLAVILYLERGVMIPEPPVEEPARGRTQTSAKRAGEQAPDVKEAVKLAIRG